MSAPRRRLDLSPRARQDFADLLLYSRRQWGSAQRSKYQAGIDRALNDLVQFPELGHVRDDLRPGLLARVVQQHVIYYRIESDLIRVERILHVRRDAAAAFNP
jgi:toxin ParE1/3/4